MKIEINKTQAQALLGLIDSAVRAEGLKVASTAAFFHTLLETAAAEEAGNKTNTPVDVAIVR